TWIAPPLCRWLYVRILKEIWNAGRRLGGAWLAWTSRGGSVVGNSPFHRMRRPAFLGRHAPLRTQVPNGMEKMQTQGRYAGWLCDALPEPAFPGAGHGGQGRGTHAFRSARGSPGPHAARRSL